ncbi:hypothetical protein [Jannaschia ovalis]|uniref:Flagellar FliJ protein n=1 Tax=Jannaschia ovalis TaxID=3038773 RepID=A0ABY8LIE9_9RHOB|nr:hypothetical protein [Jannaschia sp. GRR-S6-38]WGH80175.1 hypothetical protein P8627_07890 [Jannaschia sp. GRR-S6-38]
MTPRELRSLRALAQLRAERSGRDLAVYRGRIAALEARRATLTDQPLQAPETLAEAAAQDRWLRWRAAELSQLSLAAARLHAAAQPQREAHARDRARSEVIDRLIGSGKA